MTPRDMQVLTFLTATRLASTKQIQDAFFYQLNPSVSYSRLKYLTDNKFLKRDYYRIGHNSNTHIYYLDKKPSKRTLEHDLLITQFYVELKKLNFEIISFEKTPIYKGFKPDAIIEFKKQNGETRKLFLEVQLSDHDCISKYYNINPNNSPDIPNQLWIITNKPQEDHKIRNLRIIIDDIELTKLQRYFT